MEALLIVLAGVAFAAPLAGLGYIVRLVVRHEATDAAVIASVGGLDKQVDRLETSMDRRFDHLEAKIDRLLDRTAA